METTLGALRRGNVWWPALGDVLTWTPCARSVDDVPHPHCYFIATIGEIYCPTCHAELVARGPVARPPDPPPAPRPPKSPRPAKPQSDLPF